VQLETQVPVIGLHVYPAVVQSVAVVVTVQATHDPFSLHFFPVGQVVVLASGLHSAHLFFVVSHLVNPIIEPEQ
jgi:hypothetical protein